MDMASTPTLAARGLEPHGLTTAAAPEANMAPAVVLQEVARYPEMEVLAASASTAQERRLSPDGLHYLGEDLMSKIASEPALEAAWGRMMSAAKLGKAPGVDGLGVAQAYAQYCLDKTRIIEALRNGQYWPAPVRRVEIPKPNGGTRFLGIPNVRDRVAQDTIRQELEPRLDPDFTDSSFGFRPRRSLHMAVEHMRKSILKGYEHAVKVDLSKFFDTVDHDLLQTKLRGIVGDVILLELIRRFLKAGVQVKGSIQPTEQGVPQGGPLSTLLANIMLHSLDKRLDRLGHVYARYADDFVILCRTRKAAKRVMLRTTCFLETELRLKVNREKSRIYAVKDGFEFLGLDIKGSRVTIPDEAVGRFISYVREYARHWVRKQSDERIKHDLSRINGWLAHYQRYIDRRALRRIYRGMRDTDAEGRKDGNGGELRKRPPSMFRIWSNILGRRDRELPSKQETKTGPTPQRPGGKSTTSVRPPQGVDVFAERGPVT